MFSNGTHARISFYTFHEHVGVPQNTHWKPFPFSLFFNLKISFMMLLPSANPWLLNFCFLFWFPIFAPDHQPNCLLNISTSKLQTHSNCSQTNSRCFPQTWSLSSIPCHSSQGLHKYKSGFIIDHPTSLSLHTMFVSCTVNPTKTKMLSLLVYHCVPCAWQGAGVQYVLLNEIIVPDCLYFGIIFDKFIKANGVLKSIVRNT